MEKTYFDKVPEMAKFLIHDSRIDESDILSIIRTAGNKYAQKNGVEKAKADLSKFSRPENVTQEWLEEILTVLNPGYLEFSDPVTGEFTTEAFMSIS